MELNSSEEYSISFAKLIKDNELEIIYLPDLPEDIFVNCTRVNRPGLQFSGFYDHYEAERLQIIGKVEYRYLMQQSEETRYEMLETFCKTHPVGVIITTDMQISEKTVHLAEKYGVPLLRTKEKTSSFMASLISYLNVQLAPRITRHGVLVEIYGEGVLILGDSGIGKSETAIELLKRGHRLIADDAVTIKRVSKKTLVGEAPEIIRYYVEMRGIGIVDVRRIFGMGAVKNTEKIDLVVNLENWENGKMYERLGSSETTEILEISVPSITIPVSPGRNLAVILEIAAMNNKQKKMGYDTLEEFNQRYMEKMGL